MGTLLLAVFMLLMRLLAPNLFLQAFTPLFQLSDTLGTRSHAFFTHFSDAAKLAELNEKVTNENIALASENQDLLQKVANLSALLGAPTLQKEIPGILAGVVARPPMSPYDTLVLAVGSSGGVTLGMEAFGEGNMPVGIVSNVLNDFSRVTLFSSPNMTTNGWVGHANVPLILIGAGAGVLQASTPRVANISVGDIVFVPGPGQLPIGSVIRVDSDPLSPGVTLRIRPASNPFTASWVVLRATGSVLPTFATSTLP